MSTSSNGWFVPPQVPTRFWDIPGSDVTVQLLDNYVGFSIVHFLTWYVDAIEPLVHGQVFGGINDPRPPRGSRTGITNHASFTAVDANSLRHMQGTHEQHFDKGEVLLIENRLYWMHRVGVNGGPKNRPHDWDTNDNGGVVRWGHDYKRAPEDDMHYEWNRTPTGSATGLRLASRLADTPRGREVLDANHDSRFVVTHRDKLRR